MSTAEVLIAFHLRRKVHELVECSNVVQVELNRRVVVVENECDTSGEVTAARPVRQRYSVEDEIEDLQFAFLNTNRNIRPTFVKKSSTVVSSFSTTKIRLTPEEAAGVVAGGA